MNWKYRLQSKRVRILAALLIVVSVGTSQLTHMSADISRQDQDDSTNLVRPSLQLQNWFSADQDDFCVWVNEENPQASYIISSDKTAHEIFTYDLEGNKVSQLYVDRPGNIDIAKDFPLGDQKVDLIVVNQRREPRQLVACTIDRKTGQLSRIDHEKLLTGKNYGGCLCKDIKTGKFYFVSTSKTRGITQYELYDQNGKIASRIARSWPSNVSEAAVANDSKGILYIADELRGVRKLDIEPNENTPGELVIRIGENNLVGEVEGLTLLKISETESYLIVSDQGSSTFRVYREEEGYPHVGDFQIAGAIKTDGIELMTTSLGKNFPHGIFLCHTDQKPRPCLVTPLERILEALPVSK